MAKYLKLNPPKRGSKITVAKNGQLQVPDDPIVPFIQSDGISVETWKHVARVLEHSVEQCYGNAKRLEWLEVHAGERANQLYGPNNWLPEDSIRAIQEYKVCIKGPLTTPVGAPKSTDVLLREKLDLFARVNPILHVDGVPSPLASPRGMDLVVFREHAEDVYAEIEWKKGSPEAKQVINFINNEMGKKGDNAIRPDSSVGVKPISATATKRVVRLALEYAIKHKRRSCTFVHKGNVMRLTEGFFRDWGYELAEKEFGDYIVTEQRLYEDYKGEMPRGRVLVRDRLAEQVFQELLVRPDEYDVIATTNLNGDSLSAVATAMTGDPAIMPTSYVGAKAALFQAAPATAKSDVGEEANPCSVLLAGVMLFEHLGWKDSAELVQQALIKTVSLGTVTYDLARKVEGGKLLKVSEFCDRMIDNFEEVRKSRVRQAMERASMRL
jgi:isocitrate dehydrogenase